MVANPAFVYAVIDPCQSSTHAELDGRKSSLEHTPIPKARQMRYEIIARPCKPGTKVSHCRYLNFVLGIAKISIFRSTIQTYDKFYILLIYSVNSIMSI